ncbi:MAG: metallophosphoesterase [Bacteroidota bacterium]
MQEYKIRLALILLSIIILIDVYAWQGIKTLLAKKSKKVTRVGRLIYWGTTLVLVSAFLLGYIVLSLETNGAYRVYVAATIFILYVSKFVLCLFVFIDDLRRGFSWVKLKYNSAPKLQPIPEHHEPVEYEKTKLTRSQFIATTGTIAAAAPLILLTKGVFKGAYDYRIHRVPLYLKNLPDAFEGLRILQLSDIHTGSLLDEDAVKKGVDMAIGEKADVVFFTGDLVNNETTEAYRYAQMFRDIKAPMGVFSTFGNHDYGDYIQWKDPEDKKRNLENLAKLHGDMGWNLLRNESITLDKGGQRIGIIGVENWGSTGRFQRLGDIDKAKSGLPDVPVKLLLSHDPSHFDEIISKKHKDIDVTFSGHTHGMQFGFEFGKFRWSPAKYVYPRWAGLYEADGSRMYVNRGFGFLGYPGRVGILPEITVFELKKFESKA